MNKISRLLAALTVVGGVACSNHDKRILVGGEAIEITIAESSIVDDIQITDFFRSQYIVLEHSQESLVGNIDRVEITDSLIFILDSDITNSLYLFGKSGKYLNKLSAIGRGPGEYNTRIDDFVVDTINKEIHLLCGNQQKIFVYNFDSEYLRNVDVPDFPYGMCRFSSGNYLLTGSSGAINLTNLDQEGRVISSYMEGQGVSRFMKKNMSKMTDQCMVSFPFSNYIFSVTDSGDLMKQFYLSYEGSVNGNEDKELIKSEESLKRMSLYKYEYIDGVLLFEFFFNGTPHYGLRTDGVNILARRLWLDFMPNFTVVGNSGDGIILAADAFETFNFFTNNGLPPNLGLEGLTEDGNPLLAILYRAD